MTTPKSMLEVSRRRLTRRRFLATTAAAAGSLTIAACAGSDDEGPGGGNGDNNGSSAGTSREPGALLYSRDSWRWPDETDQAVPGGVLSEYLLGGAAQDLPEGLDPVAASSGSTVIFVGLAYEFLVRPNRGPGIQPGTPEYQELKAHLADGWEVSADGVSYSFRIRPGVKFHPLPPVNGREMTIEDWRASYDRWTQLSPFRNGMAEVVDRVEYPDESHMVFHLKEPYGPFLTRMTNNLFSFRPAPKELMEDTQLANSTLIGTGPRVLDSYQPSITREFRKNEDYWQGTPFIDRWHYPILPEYANARAQFVAQNIIAFTPQLTDALLLRQDVPQAIMVGQEISTTSVASLMRFGGVEAETAPWADERVRWAMRRAVDYHGITQFWANAEEFQSNGIDIETSYSTHVPPDPNYWLDPREGELGDASQNYLFSVDEAKKLLSAAGYADGVDLDGYCTAGPGGSYSEQYVERMNMMADEYRKSGLVRVNLNWLPHNEFSAEILRGADWKGVQMPYQTIGNEVDQLLSGYHSRDEDSIYTDPEVDRLIDEQRRESDPQRRSELIKQLQPLLAKLMPEVPGDGRVSSFQFQWPWLRNVSAPGSGRDYLEWLSPDMPKRNG